MLYHCVASSDFDCALEFGELELGCQSPRSQDVLGWRVGLGSQKYFDPIACLENYRLANLKDRKKVSVELAYVPQSQSIEYCERDSPVESDQPHEQHTPIE